MEGKYSLKVNFVLLLIWACVLVFSQLVIRIITPFNLGTVSILNALGFMLLWFSPYIIGGIITGLYITRPSQQFYLIPVFVMLGVVWSLFGRNYGEKVYILTGVLTVFFIGGIASEIAFRLKAWFGKRAKQIDINPGKQG